MRSSRGLLALLALMVLLALLFLSAGAVAQDEASARVEPATAPPGGDLSLIFEMSSPDLAEVVVQERVTCQVTFPDDTERRPCDRTGTIAEVRTTGSGAQEYVFEYQAPAVDGSYDVSFEADSTARVLPATYTASTVFDVDASQPTSQADPSEDGVPPEDTPDEEGPSSEPGADPPGASGEGDDETLADLGADTASSRIMASTTLATGVLAVTLVANRFPLREVLT